MNPANKDELRAKLMGMKHRNFEVASERVLKGLVDILQERNDVRTVLLYESVAKWQELDISPLPALLPDIRFETVRPLKDAPFPTKKFDVVVIPLLGFNDKGYRLGRGGGWYDKFLATQPHALKIGVGYENTLVDFTPERHDVRLDAVVTEQSTIVQGD